MLFILFIVFAGCSYNANCWYKPEATQEETQRDFNECVMYGKAHSEMNPFMAMDLTQDCMLNKGYSKK